ncbi:uncharacterized protein LOC133298299 isoform X2 [Gastrolobium bilobum]|uniref:uncharacterized protein LOC133298299 isoform X2 n=1 Tax=Gastrolobium bilobum TaxID=150636 RepID=UPI002AAFA2A1|nr:uncharacterized protein LOC133298299 isoform X2 [Gastrolobium bilobum]
MGGGGAMRTAAKIAGVGVPTQGLRGAPVVHSIEQSVWNSSRPVSGAGVSAKAAEVAPLHTVASWDLDEWDFADGGDLVMEAGEPTPRVVFGAVPTFQEAKEATTELKEAIDQIYLSPDSSRCEGSSPGSEVSVMSPTLFEPGTKSRVIEAISNPSLPNHAFQAFQLLSNSYEAQTVVASIACDPNVWKAVMENPAVNNFFQSQQTVAGSEALETPEKEEAESNPGNGLFDFVGDILQNFKLTVTEMVSRLSNYLQSIFPTPEKEKPDADADGNAKANFLDNKNLMGGTFMGLAVIVIMVVLVRRA